MDGTQSVESVVCCEQGPGPLQDIWTGHWKHGADVVWLSLLSQSWTIQDIWITQHCAHETGSRELERESGAGAVSQTSVTERRLGLTLSDSRTEAVLRNCEDYGCGVEQEWCYLDCLGRGLGREFFGIRRRFWWRSRMAKIARLLCCCCLVGCFVFITFFPSKKSKTISRCWCQQEVSGTHQD